jgi:hypothetical protein
MTLPAAIPGAFLAILAVMAVLATSVEARAECSPEERQRMQDAGFDSARIDALCGPAAAPPPTTDNAAMPPGLLFMDAPATPLQDPDLATAVAQMLTTREGGEECTRIMTGNCAQQQPLTRQHLSRCLDIRTAAIDTFSTPGADTASALAAATTNYPDWCALRELVSTQLDCMQLALWLAQYAGGDGSTDLMSRCLLASPPSPQDN